MKTLLLFTVAMFIPQAQAADLDCLAFSAEEPEGIPFVSGWDEASRRKTLVFEREVSLVSASTLFKVDYSLHHSGVQIILARGQGPRDEAVALYLEPSENGKRTGLLTAGDHLVESGQLGKYLAYHVVCED